MSPATRPRAPLTERLLVIDPASGDFTDAAVTELPRFLRKGDIVVVNDAATLPASLHGTLGGAPIELRLAGAPAEAPEGTFAAVLFGAGDWRTKTEHRASPPVARAGDVLTFAGALEATVIAVDDASPRLLVVRFDRAGARLWSALYVAGKPVQYAYIERELRLWDVQTSYASRPWAMEMASAGRPLSSSLLGSLAGAGVALAAITHAAGLSSTGDDALDARLPLAERYDIPEATVRAIADAKVAGGRVVAVGTTVVRALEGAAAANGGRLRAGEGTTSILLGPGFRAQVVDGLLTGMHEPTASHFALLQAFAPLGLLARAYALAEASGYLGHEFGDSNLILRAR
ncbi:MAG: S-adenosylmethionine:tRNA ribosyltransferase-isomerase [Myxococcaceae bacterium]|nr:S-adenosylmethionine:tRNA ribosyltransferase-isomerase [Myxococcaceae bacterium]